MRLNLQSFALGNGLLAWALLGSVQVSSFESPRPHSEAPSREMGPEQPRLCPGTRTHLHSQLQDRGGVLTQGDFAGNPGPAPTGPEAPLCALDLKCVNPEAGTMVFIAGLVCFSGKPA